MQDNQHYTQLLQDLKSRISQSRYIAARLVNREQLMLYYYVGKLLNDKITQHNWGDKILVQIGLDLKEQMPNLRGFSAGNLKKMRQFYTAYEHNPIGPLLTGQLQDVGMQRDINTGQLHFYLNVLDDKIKLPNELPSIGIILCKEKQDAVVQYSIRNMNTPMGVATFMNSCEPPVEIQQVLPDSDQLRRLI